MTKKETKIETKIETETILGVAQGTDEVFELIPTETKKEKEFNNIVERIQAGKQYILREGYTRNSVYTLCKKLKAEASLNVAFGQTKTGTYPTGFKRGDKDLGGKDILQFVLFPMKEEKA